MAVPMKLTTSSDVERHLAVTCAPSPIESAPGSRLDEAAGTGRATPAFPVPAAQAPAAGCHSTRALSPPAVG